jgi:hypothetical protein
MNARETLAGSLQRRLHTSHVARAILELDPAGLPADAVAPLRRLDRGPHNYWMNDDFDRPVAADRQVETWLRLFGAYRSVDGRLDPANPAHLRELAGAGLSIVYLDNHPTAQDALRAHSGKRLKGSTRKRLRFLARLERRADALEDSWRLRWAQMQAKSRLAYLVDPDRLDDLELAYVAYVAARANRRSEFVLGPQSRMKDEIVDSLEAALLDRDASLPLRHASRAWAEIALVRPVPQVFERCRPEELGRLVGVFHGEMADAAEELSRLYESLPTRMRAEMVMVKGVDSSRWNAYAGALNSMRSAWLAATLAAGLDTRDRYLPGKAPRLMAADLAWWYRSQGMDLHEDTTLFAALPKPWDVVLGRRNLTLTEIEARAHDLLVDVSTGWTGPRRGEAAERPEPEPALVHGIAVEDPQLAATLRRCGVFSGKALRELDRLPDALVRAEVTDGRRTRVPVLGAAAREREPR